MTIGVDIALALTMLAGNAFFVGAEFGLVSSRRSNIELAALEGSKAAKITLNAMERVPLMLAGSQLGVTLCSLIFGAVGEPLVTHLIEQPFASIGLTGQPVHVAGFIIALVILTYLHVIIGEMVPKNIALAGPTRIALWLTPPLVLFVKLTLPIVHILNAVARGFLRLFGIKPSRELASSFNRDEVAGFIKESHREGLLSEDEEQLLSGALKFERTNIAAVLLPLQTLVTVPRTASAEDIEALAAGTGFSRFPVQSRNGELQGYIHIKDLLEITPSHQADKLELKLIRDLPEIKLRTSLRTALVTMQQQGAHLAKVVDTKNNTLGVVALEDLLEELVGSIRDDA